jgi:hypothetical protein
MVLNFLKQKLTTLILLVTLASFSCTEDAGPQAGEEAFTRIYDNNRFSSSYSPIDMVQTPDKGYLILGSRRLSDSNFAGIYLMKVDKRGEFVDDVEVDAQYVNPIGRLMSLDGEYYFFCMEELTLQTQMAKVSAALENVDITPLQDNLSYPAAVTLESNTFILLSYDHVDKLSRLSLINPSGGTEATKGFDIGIGENVEEPIINHFIGTGRRFPFQTGRIPGGAYFFNGFYNYTFSLVFTDLNQDDPLGVVQGQQDDGGFSAVTPIASTKFAASRFNFGDNFLLPNVILPSNDVTSSIDYPGNTLPELVPNANVRILRALIGGTNTLIFGSDTKSKQIALLFYDEASGTLIGSHYLGFSNPFEIASIVQTGDDGLAVCGTTYLAGRFPRICLFKLSKADLEDKVK